MYEKVWEGAAPGLDGTEWDLTLEFDESTGLFRCTGALNGETVESHECVDPVISGFMDEPGDRIVLDLGGMPLIPGPPLEMQGRFAPFSSPDQIVAGTWRTPRDWPEARKAATAGDLETRMLNIVSSGDEVKSYRAAVKECSRLLNSMYGDPSRWPRSAVDALLDYPRGTMPGNEYHDAGLDGHMLPPEFSAAIISKGSALAGRVVNYRDAVYALFQKATSDSLVVEPDWQNRCFGVIPSVDVAQFICELSEGDTVTLSLAANFDSFGMSTVDLGDVQLDLKSAGWYRSQLGVLKVWDGSFDGHVLGKLPLEELHDYIENSLNGLFYANWEGAFLDGEYGVDIDGDADRVLICAEVIHEHDNVDGHGIAHGECSWRTVSWSKAEHVYHVELYRARKHLNGALMGSEQGERQMDATFASFPSEYLPDMRTMPMMMTSEPETFVNARYACDPDRLLKGRLHEGSRNKTVPGTAALKEGLAKLDKNAKVNQSQNNESRGRHV